MGTYIKGEKKIRKNWLWATITLFILLPVAVSFVFAMSGISVPSETKTYLIYGLFWFGGLYHCAYLRKGRLLLTWALATNSLYFFSRTALLVFYPFCKNTKLLDFIDPITLIGLAPFFIWWFVASRRLRKVNMQLTPCLSENEPKQSKETEMDSLKKAEKEIKEKILKLNKEKN